MILYIHANSINNQFFNQNEAIKLIALIEGKFLDENDIARALLKNGTIDYLKVMIESYSPVDIKRHWEDWVFANYFIRQPLNSMSRAEAHNYNKRAKEDEKTRKQIIIELIEKKKKSTSISRVERNEWYKLEKFLKGPK